MAASALFPPPTISPPPGPGQNLEVSAYLILVISFTPAGFLNPYILHPEITKNTQKLQQIAPKSVKYVVFRVQSGNFYT